MNILAHALIRISERLNPLVTEDEVQKVVSSRRFPDSGAKCSVVVKQIPYTEIKDSSVKPDGIARGNQIVAIVENNTITTVELRKGWSNSDKREYRFNKR
jgi:hypothetical protein